MGNNGEDKLTKMEQAIADDETCARCKSHYPGHTPVALPYAQQKQQRIVSRGQQNMECAMAFICSNPKSPRYQTINHIFCSCDEFEGIPQVKEVEVPLKIANRIKGK